MMTREATLGTVGAGILALILAATGEAQEVSHLETEAEIRLAMSAGPLTVSQDADVFVFGEGGFTKAVEGTNGYACMVIRQAEAPEVLAPHCFSPDAVTSVLPAKLEEGRLIARGESADAVERRLLADFETGRLPLPEGNAFAYMLSSGQRLGAAGRWKPHFMLYMPYATNEDVGGIPGRIEFPFVGPVANHPHSTMVIVMPEFVHPEDVVISH